MAVRRTTSVPVVQRQSGKSSMAFGASSSLPASSRREAALTKAIGRFSNMPTLGRVSEDTVPFVLKKEGTSSSEGGENGVAGQSSDTAYCASLEAMLAEQRIANQRALQLTEMIAHQLTTERLQSMQEGFREVTSESADSSGRPRRLPTGFAQPKTTAKVPTPCFDKELSEPLLSFSTDDDPPYVPRIAENQSESLGEKLEHQSGNSNGVPSRPKSRVQVKSAASKPIISTHMFPTVEGVKELIVESLSQAEVKEEDLHQRDGCWSRLIQNPCFSNTTLVVIIMNTLWIAVDTDYNKAEVLAKADWQFQLVDNLFCTFFTLEMFVRFMAFKRKRYAFTDPWFLFDGFLVALMIWETWIGLLLFNLGMEKSGSGVGAGSVLRIFRIFRLLRVARTARLLSSVPELLILTKGMFFAMRSVIVILGLLAFIIYIFSVVFTQLLSGTKVNTLVDNRFQTVPEAANFLLLQVLCGFDPDIADTLRKNDISCYILFILYLLIGSLTILNMLIGILCDVVFTVADDHKEEVFEREMNLKVESLAASLDVSNRGVVAAEDFEQVIQRADVIQSLNELGVDVAGLVEFAMFVFQDHPDLSYGNFLHMVLQFRTGKPATVKDVMDLRKQVSGQLSHILEFILRLQSKLWSMDQVPAAINNDVEGSACSSARSWGKEKEEQEEEEDADDTMEPRSDTIVSV